MAKSRKSSSGGAQRVKQLLIAVVLVVATVFAVQGGEYGTRDLMRQSSRRVALLHTNDSLTHIIDSLKKYKHRVETDAALQERIAREEFGMIRGNKELLYKLSDP